MNNRLDTEQQIGQTTVALSALKLNYTSLLFWRVFNCSQKTKLISKQVINKYDGCVKIDESKKSMHFVYTVTFQDSAATCCKVWWKLLNDFCWKFHSLCRSKGILKMVNIWQVRAEIKMGCFYFSRCANVCMAWPTGSKLSYSLLDDHLNTSALPQVFQNLFVFSFQLYFAPHAVVLQFCTLGLYK